jgi:hypothetical protein
MLDTLYFYLEIRQYGGFGNVKGPLSMSAPVTTSVAAALWI